MFEITKRFTFHAAHCLPLHDGKCKRPHGHSYQVILTATSSSLVSFGPKSGMVIDFTAIKEMMQPILDQKLDHQDLNQTLPVEHTTAEEIARWLYFQLAPWFITKRAVLKSVTVCETDSSSCTFYEE